MKSSVQHIVADIHQYFLRHGLTLAVAESCTGGLISHMITSIPGASTIFKSGIVAYSRQAKEEMLGISPDVMNEFGMVSGETAIEMAEKVRLLAKADYAAAATGNLGPDVLEGKDRGLIYLAASREGKAITRELHLPGTRDENKTMAAEASLKLILQLAESNK
ncbi:MAG: CinA family protein [Nitrospiraceae bacterium]|nr:MAG: CinA family protein [Nitrospiraceae bacterium]